MAIILRDFLEFPFNDGRGIRANQIDGGEFHFRTTVPDNSIGRDGDRALVRVSSIMVHAYEKTTGAWVRQWAFSGGDTVLLAGGLDAPAIRIPSEAADGNFNRYVGISGYAPVTSADYNAADPQNPVPSPQTGGFGGVAALAELRGGVWGTSSVFRSNDIDLSVWWQRASATLQYNLNVSVYLWFGLHPTLSAIDITSVTRNGVGVPVVAQTVMFDGQEYRIWRTVATWTQAEIAEHPFVLTTAQNATAIQTYNRYSAVTANPVPTPADFLSEDKDADDSGSMTIRVPRGGYTAGSGYLHFALPAGQVAPTVVGLPGGTNLIDDFDVRSSTAAITINGDAMRTLSSKAPVFDGVRGDYWIVR